MTTTELSASEVEPVDPPPPPPDDGDGGDDGDGWWSASPTWAKAVLAGGVALVLLLVGALVGGLVARESVTTYGPPEGSVDVAFLQDMSAHHRQAIQMAVAERRTTDPEMAQLAFDIETSQTMQVGSMEGWLRLWEQPTATPDGLHMGWMGMPTPSMPGMASEPELASLRTLGGRDLDVRFLQLMLRHHEGGFSMLQAAQDRAQVPAVTTLASAMLRAQTSEAVTMRAMLAARGAAPLPSPTHDMAHGGTAGGN